MHGIADLILNGMTSRRYDWVDYRCDTSSPDTTDAMYTYLQAPDAQLRARPRN